MVLFLFVSYVVLCSMRKMKDLSSVCGCVMATSSQQSCMSIITHSPNRFQTHHDPQHRDPLHSNVSSAAGGRSTIFPYREVHRLGKASRFGASGGRGEDGPWLRASQAAPSESCAKKCQTNSETNSAGRTAWWR